MIYTNFEIDCMVGTYLNTYIFWGEALGESEDKNFLVFRDGASKGTISIAKDKIVKIKVYESESR